MFPKTNVVEKLIVVMMVETAEAITTKKLVRQLPLLPPVIRTVTLATQTWHQSKISHYLRFSLFESFLCFRNWDGAPPRYQSSHPIPGHAAASEYERPPPYNFAGPYPVAPSEAD